MEFEQVGVSTVAPVHCWQSRQRTSLLPPRHRALLQTCLALHIASSRGDVRTRQRAKAGA
eukprot:896317-Amphidinium_carterae.1